MTSTFDRHDTRTTAPASVVAHVRELIDAAALGPGARLPPERDLALRGRREPADGSRRTPHARGARRDPIAARVRHLHPRGSADARRPTPSASSPRCTSSPSTMSTRRGASWRSAPPAWPPNARRRISSRRWPTRSPACLPRSRAAGVPGARHQFPPRRRRGVGQSDRRLARRDGVRAVLRTPPCHRRTGGRSRSARRGRGASPDLSGRPRPRRRARAARDERSPASRRARTRRREQARLSALRVSPVRGQGSRVRGRAAR